VFRLWDEFLCRQNIRDKLSNPHEQPSCQPPRPEQLPIADGQSLAAFARFGGFCRRCYRLAENPRKIRGMKMPTSIPNKPLPMSRRILFALAAVVSFHLAY